MSFLPVIRPDTSTSTVKEAERLYKQAVRDALGDESVAKAIAPYKTNGIVTGHKVLDDGEAVRSLEKHASGRAKEMFGACSDISLYRRTQLLNQALRREWVMDKDRKISDSPSQSKVKRLERNLQLREDIMPEQVVIQMDRRKRLLDRADNARSKGIEAYIEFAQALVALSSDGMTQEEIGKRYNMSRSAVMQACRVGKDARIGRNPTNAMPHGQSTLYLLTTLDDKEFEMFAKSNTTEHEIRDYKTSKKQKKPEKQFKLGWRDLINERFNVFGPVAGAGNKKLRKRLEVAWGKPVPSYFNDKAEAEEFASKVATVFNDREDARPKLSETAEQKLQRAIAIETKRLSDSFFDEIHKEVVRRLPEVRAQWEHDMAEAREETTRYAKLSSGIAKRISADEYKLLLNLLHPDRHPEDKRARFEDGFRIVMRLKDYAEA
jgi:hypothetical protein